MSTLNVDYVADSSGTQAVIFPKQTKAQFYLSPIIVDENYTVPSNFNAITAGPIEIANNITVEVANGSTWSII